MRRDALSLRLACLLGSIGLMAMGQAYPWGLLAVAMALTLEMAQHVRRTTAPAPPLAPGADPELEKRWKERLALESAFQELAGESFADGLFGLMQKQIGASTLALFGPEGPERQVGSGAQELEGWRLAGRSEAHLAEAVRSGRVLAVEGSTLIAGEPHALYLPLGGEAVLYLGRSRPFQSEEQELLRLLQGPARLARESARRRQNEQAALAAEQELRALLEGRVERLGLLEGGLRALAGASEPVLPLLEFLESLQADMVGVWVREEGRLRQAAGPDPGPAAEAVLQACLENRLPLSLDGSHRLARDLPCASLLAVPIAADPDPMGVILLLSSTQEAFGREVQDLVTAMAAGAASALKNVALQQQLLHSNKLAAMGQLAAGLAHELNTPLGAALIGIQAAERLAERGGDPRSKLESAEGALKKASRTVERLLSYARRSGPEREAVDLVEVASEALALLQFLAERKKVRVETSWGPLPSMRGNPLELQQLVSNLVSNALDAVTDLPAEARWVKVSTRQEEGASLLEVSDGGPGPDPALRAQIFEPFHTSKPAGKGTGLGLPLARQVAQGHGGRLELREGLPTTFRLTL